MHQQAYEWAASFGTEGRVRVLDIGGRDINGTVRALFPRASAYVSVDLYPGPAVDHVADITRWESKATFDVVVCCEVLEHAENWREVIAAAYERCKDGGRFVMTCAGPSRVPHSALDGAGLRDDEYYGNVDPDELTRVLTATGWTSFVVDDRGDDVRCTAVR